MGKTAKRPLEVLDHEHKNRLKNFRKLNANKYYGNFQHFEIDDCVFKDIRY